MPTDELDRVYELVKEEEELEEQATGWHRAIKLLPCFFCQKLVAPESLFCPHCGFAMIETKQRTTASQKLVRALPLNQVPTNVLPKHDRTNAIAAAKIPGEKHAQMKAYKRVLEKEKK